MLHESGTQGVAVPEEEKVEGTLLESNKCLPTVKTKVV